MDTAAPAVWSTLEGRVLAAFLDWISTCSSRVLRREVPQVVPNLLESSFVPNSFGPINRTNWQRESTYRKPMQPLWPEQDGFDGVRRALLFSAAENTHARKAPQEHTP